jgi:hypothetical protein
MLTPRKQTDIEPIISALNDGTNTFDSSDVLQVTGILPVNGYVKITGVATIRLIDVSLKRSSGPFVGKFSSDNGHNFATGEWSTTELRVYNLSDAQAFASGDVKITYTEAQ